MHTAFLHDTQHTAQKRKKPSLMKVDRSQKCVKKEVIGFASLSRFWLCVSFRNPPNTKNKQTKQRQREANQVIDSKK